MTDNQEQKGMPGGCCGDDARYKCCEQMMNMMHNHCGDSAMGFDGTALMQKMGCSTPEPAEEK